MCRLESDQGNPLEEGDVRADGLAPFDWMRLEKATADEGFEITRGNTDGWIAFESLGAPAAALRLTAIEGHYFVAMDHGGIVADLYHNWTHWPSARLPLPPGFSAFVADDTAALHDLVREIWRLARALPEAPLRRFEAKIRALPRSTEAEWLMIQRVGQGIYRDALLEYWQGQCAITGYTVPALLRASRAKPRKGRESDVERLDVYNGLLFAMHSDAASNAGLIAVAEDGTLIISPHLDQHARTVLGLDMALKVGGHSDAHKRFLAWHRARGLQ